MSDIYETNTTSNTYSEEDAYAPVPEGAMPTETYMDENGVFLGQVYTDNLVVGNAKIQSAMIENITTDQIVAGNAKISAAMIETLVVGKNVQMGENATISWSQVSNKPSIPQTASDVGALPANSPKLTYIDAYGIYTGTINANQITAGTISGDLIQGGTITGAQFKSGSVSNPFRIYIGPAEIDTYNVANFYSGKLSMPNASLVFDGSLYTKDASTPLKFFIGQSANPMTIYAGTIQMNTTLNASAINIQGDPVATQSWVLSQDFLKGGGAVDSGNESGAWYRWRYNTNTYFRINHSGAAVVVNGNPKAIWASMPKISLEPAGDGITDGREFGANNPASMQPVLFDFFIGVPVNGERRIDLDEKFLEYVSSYDVFLSSGSGVVVKEKGKSYIVLQGTGTVSFFVAGIQRGKEDIVGYTFVDADDGLGGTVREFSERRIKRY